MKKAPFPLRAFLVLLCLILLFFPLPHKKSPLGSFSLECFRKLFEIPQARQIFDLEEEEAAAVFGDGNEGVFV